MSKEDESNHATKQSRVVLVTGAASGIGYETARAFGRTGDHVFLCDVNRDALEAAVEALRPEVGGVEMEQGSVAVASDVERILTRVDEAFGKLDVVVANAGICLESPITDMETKSWDSLFDTNCRGVFLVCGRAARMMRAQGSGGTILVTNSINSRMPEPGGVAYASSKAAIDVFIRVLAVELAADDIRVCGVSPGYTDTNMVWSSYDDPEQVRNWIRNVQSRTPLGRLAHASEIADVFLFLASPQARYITGTSIVVDGGRSVAA